MITRLGKTLDRQRDPSKHAGLGVQGQDPSRDLAPGSPWSQSDWMPQDTPQDGGPWGPF